MSGLNYQVRIADLPEEMRPRERLLQEGPEQLSDAELLAIRSTTGITERLLAGSAVRFVGTATIGTDHLDIPYLEANDIYWCYSPGCNANSVAEYVASALLWIGQKGHLSLRNKTIGVVGVGNVGSRVVRVAEALGMRVLQNDPPRQRTEPENEFLFTPLDHLFHGVNP